MASLEEMGRAWGDPQVCLGRELTKLHEEILRGTASAVAAILAKRPGIKGEIAVAAAPSPQRCPPARRSCRRAVPTGSPSTTTPPPANEPARRPRPRPRQDVRGHTEVARLSLKALKGLFRAETTSPPSTASPSTDRGEMVG
ncbi:MAG: hypothetical protein IPN03_24095 [Holophagales bacterium]|nr:hypothetical protein [Holophagales bacterium]